MDTPPASRARRGLRAPWLAAGLALALAAAGTTQAAPPAAPASAATVTLAPVLVIGVVPGPALWRVSKGDHVLWVLGTVTPLPADIRWDSSRVQGLIATSQEVIELPGVGVGAEVGFWQGLRLLPTMIGIKKLPDGRTLKEVLPPPLYARWLVQKDKYLTGMKGWHDDRLRPVFAADELYAAAIKANGLASATHIQARVLKLAKRDKVQVINPAYTATLKDPLAAAREFKATELKDEACLAQTLDAVAGKLTQARTRANAWARGDVDALRSVYRHPQVDACLAALADTQIAANAGLNHLHARSRARWVEVASAALAHNRSTLALLPMGDVLSSDGYLAALAAKGYTVTAPGG